jgi:hypothetical protein
MPDEQRKPGESISQHPFVSQVRPDPSAPPSAVAQLEGLAGNSDREGWARLYFNRSLTYYAEFRKEDVVSTAPIPPEQSPIAGIEATRVGLRQDAVIEYTRTTRARPQDEFDLGIQLGAAPSGVQAQLPIQRTIPDGCVPRTIDTCRTDCFGVTCDTCRTQCGQATCVGTCQTCQTQCGQATCVGTCQTCQTQCGQATCQTCQTCQTQCGQATCQTCVTDCRQRTCLTCDTCNPHVFTCGPNPQCRF